MDVTPRNRENLHVQLRPGVWNIEVTARAPGPVKELALPPLEAPKVGAEGRKIPNKDRGRAKKRLMSERALRDLDAWLAGPVEAAAE